MCRSRQEFEFLYSCDFKPNHRSVELDKKLIEYYTNTSKCDNKTAWVHWRKFALWCSNMGYTQLEISASKKRVLYSKDYND